MKLFCFSDAHSYLEPLKKALDEAGFDSNNEEHYLVSLGDLFDRGPDSDSLLKYIMSLDRKILIKGNHDLLLENLCIRELPSSHDFSNGTVKTVYDLGKSSNFEMCCRHTLDKTAAYRDLLVNYFETEKYIFVHSWIPTTVTYDSGASKPWHKVGKNYKYNEDWRKATEADWEEAMWGNPFELAAQGLNKTEKTIVYGHWHCSAGWSRDKGLSEFDTDACWDPYINKKQRVIAIDACTAYTQKVNIFVIEDNFI